MTHYFPMNASEIPGSCWKRFYRGCANHCVSILFFIVKYAAKKATIRITMPSLASGQIGTLRLTSQPWSLLKPRRAPECLSAAAP